MEHETQVCGEYEISNLFGLHPSLSLSQEGALGFQPNKEERRENELLIWTGEEEKQRIKSFDISYI